MRESVLTTRPARISQHPVILSGVVVRAADDNAVEELPTRPLVRSSTSAALGNFHRADRKKPEA